MKTKKAIFLDRDGTLIVDKNYLSRVEDIEYYPDTFEALSVLEKFDYLLFVVTNQSGVGRGYFPIENVHAIHQQIQSDLKENKLSPFEEFAICPHTPDDQCECRKPSGKMIKDLIKNYQLDPKLCYMVGDKLIDAEAGENAGIQGVQIRHSQSDQFPHFKTLLEFAESLKK